MPDPRPNKIRQLAGLLTVLMAALAAASPADAHPQDGAHADLRIRLEDGRLRWRIGLNLAFMDEIAPIGREREDALDPAEEPFLRDAILSILRDENRVVADGVEVEPVLDTWLVARPDRSMLPLFPRTGMRGLIRAQIILDYPLPEAPSELRMTWARYPLDILSAELEGGEPAPLVLEARFQAEGVIELITFTEGAPEVAWQATGGTIEDRLLPVPELVLPAPSIASPPPAARSTPPDTLSVDEIVEREPPFPAAPRPAMTPGPATAPLPRGVIPPLSLTLLGSALAVCAISQRRGRPRRARVAGVFVLSSLFAAGVLTIPLATTDPGGVVGVVVIAGGAETSDAARISEPVAVAAVESDSVVPAPVPPPIASNAAPAANDPIVEDAVQTAALAVFRPLLSNVYRAFDFSEESDVYDALAFSVDGPLLDDLYRRIHRGLVMDDHDRAVAQVTGVELIDASALDAASALETGRFGVEARWQVDGTVVHWGHSHTRRHIYAARYEVARTGAGWRIVDQEMRSQERIPTRSDPLDQGVTAGIPRALDMEF